MTLHPDKSDQEIRERCQAFLSPAAEEAKRLGHNYIGAEHIFIVATRDEEGIFAQVLRKANLNPREVRALIRQEIGTADDAIGDVLPLTPRTEMILSLALFLAEQDNAPEVTDFHVLMAFLQEGESIPMRKLQELGFDIQHWLHHLLEEEYQERKDAQSSSSIINDWDSNYDLDSSDGFLADDEDADEMGLHRILGIAPPKKTATPLLDRYGRDLTAQARDGKIAPAIAREKEIRALARTLARSKKNNPLLLGDAGVGKTAIVEGLAHAIAAGSAPKPLLERRIVQIEIGNLVAGTSLRGQFEERLIGIIDEVKRVGNIILFIDEIHSIVGAGDTIDSNLDAANILKPALARGEINCVGATTHEEYRKAIAQDPALARRFRVIDVQEPSAADAIRILQDQRTRLEAHHNVEIVPDAIESAVQLSVRYLADRRLPDKALDLLDEACTRVTIRTVHPDVESSMPYSVTATDVVAVLAEWTGIPITELTTDEKHRLAHLEDVLMERVIGQEQAVRVVADAIKTARAGLNDPNRPIGAFLFVGPSGVGKTELAKALAVFLFGSEDAMLRLDMSEFHDAHTVARLIGSPPGYKESNRGGQLTDGLRRRPYCVVLLDEVEKAAPEVFDLFLQIFDEGRLSDAHGGKVDARHAVFIMTSNIGTREGGKSLGFGASETVEYDYTPHLKQFFRPEFLNRLDEVVTFRPLNEEAMRRILERQLSDLRNRLAQQQITLQLSDSARALILQQGYDPINGARPLRRALERLLIRPLSTWLLEQTPARHSVIRVEGTGAALRFILEGQAAL